MFAEDHRRRLLDACRPDRLRRSHRPANDAVRCLFGRPDHAQTASDLVGLGEKLLTARSRQWNFDFGATSSSSAARQQVDDVTGVADIDLQARGCCRSTTPESDFASPTSSPRYEWTSVGMNRGPVASTSDARRERETATHLPTSVTDENIYGDGKNVEVYRRNHHHHHHHHSSSSPLATSSSVNYCRCTSRGCVGDCRQSFVATPSDGARVPTTGCSSSLDRKYRQPSMNLWRSIPAVAGPTASHITTRDSVKRKSTIPGIYIL